MNGVRRPLEPTTLRASDVARLASSGVRGRPLRAVLSAVGIAIGIAAMVSVIGISSSSRAELDGLLDRLGTNLLTVAPGQTLFGEDAKLPPESVGMVSNIGSVTAVSATADLDLDVRRTDKVSELETGGISVNAADVDLLKTLRATVGSGRWLDSATSDFPVVVLGSEAAARLGIEEVDVQTQVWVGDRWMTVIGILDPIPLAPELDSSALIGWEFAETDLGFDGHPTRLYERSSDAAVNRVRGLLAATVNPEHPEEIKVSRPSEALAARQAADAAFTGLLVGLGGVSLLVGGVGVANTMVISVLERRGEVGLRRALGATRRHIATQFLGEAILLSLLGGAAGSLMGALVTIVYASYEGWAPVVPLWALFGGLAATVIIGAVAGLYPALRASRVSPTVALAAP